MGNNIDHANGERVARAFSDVVRSSPHPHEARSLRPTEIISNGLIVDEEMALDTMEVSGPSTLVPSNQRPSSIQSSELINSRKHGFFPCGALQQPFRIKKSLLDDSCIFPDPSISSKSLTDSSDEESSSHDGIDYQVHKGFTSDSSQAAAGSIIGSESRVLETQIEGDNFKSLDDLSEFHSNFVSPSGFGDMEVDSQTLIPDFRPNSPSQSPIASPINSPSQSPHVSPINTPSDDFFAQALVDKEKEAVVINYMKDRFLPAIEMIKAVNDVSGMGIDGDLDDIVRMLIKSAIKTPRVFNFECREVRTGV
ncbi:hypothetical protein MKW98_016054 [Papaver atlanticum]|uniref:Uncharacterized protein n=1 Tax=Papaver atlanticum TaxID=357466 RepID=A0AAD4T2Y7_9MAGN|nr:hypothetical protein MKW98_016054 [Papaver atlanticum]